MAPSDEPKPTQAELQILEVLWDLGPSTVREVFDVLSSSRSVGYTTILKLMQIMAGKGLVSRDESRRTHVYRARLTRKRTQKRLVKELIDKAFSGSAAGLIGQALISRKPSDEELAEIQKLIEQYRRENGDD
ncbi:MAG: BlaI/MecI/CopY family transcriptional regulator [Planctomycetota bacterium]